jgi:hypothetical protein
VSTGVFGETSSQLSRLGLRSGASVSILIKVFMVSSKPKGVSDTLFRIKKFIRLCKSLNGSKNVLIVILRALPSPVASFRCRKMKSQSLPGAAVASSIALRGTLVVRTRPIWLL